MAEVNYAKTLTELQFFNNLDSGRDYSTEITEIKTWSEDEQNEVADSLFERAIDEDQGYVRYLDALLSLGYIDQKYHDDMAWVLSYGDTIEIDNNAAVNKIRQITEQAPYGKSVNEGFFWQRIAAIAIGTRDNSILAPVITKIESVKDKF